MSKNWNIQDSIAHLSQNAEAKSIGKCAKYVRTAIEAGGLSTAGRPISAYQYKGYLPKIGFNALGDVTGKTKQREWSNKNAKPGDISVMDHGQHGHICMWNGKQWISDFPQNNMWVYKGDGTCTIFRYGGEVDGSMEPYNGQVGGGNGSSGGSSGSFGGGGQMGDGVPGIADGISSPSSNLTFTTPRSKQSDHTLVTDINKLIKQAFALMLEGEGVVCSSGDSFKDKYLMEDTFFKNARGEYENARIEGLYKLYNTDIEVNIDYGLTEGYSMSEYIASAALGENPNFVIPGLEGLMGGIDGINIDGLINEKDILKASHFKNTQSWIAACKKHGLNDLQTAALVACMMYECGLNQNVVNQLEFEGRGAKGTDGWHAGEGTVGFTFWNLKEQLIKQYNADSRSKQKLPSDWGTYSGSGPRIKDLGIDDAALFTMIFYDKLIKSTKNDSLDNIVAEFYLQKAGRGGSAKKGKTPVERALLRSQDYMKTHAKQGCKAKNTFALTLASARLLAGANNA